MNVIKESFDNLPAAVCIFNDKGLVRLMNHRMLMVGAMFFGSGVQTLGELQAALKQPPAGVTADLAMPGVYHFRMEAYCAFRKGRSPIETGSAVPRSSLRMYLP